jgi:hypothetical protein
MFALFLAHLQPALQLRWQLAKPGMITGVGLHALERGGTIISVTDRVGTTSVLRQYRARGGRIGLRLPDIWDQ